MDYVIELLEENRKYLERHIRDNNLMQKDMKKATEELSQVSQLKRAIKILKLKNRKQ
ncbi:hypothetical protein M2T70_16645 [Elizabethkingia anophelis]|uniref:hypothetical protein n=1 Tax=Elizabethkingia anophelis TaxID=1117645 RepID=UPI00201301ED|nr:hypothetical protein [Elizabethkingia anophelis]MCL1650592.1 hypothetical protein [Elizabethkingia anophelis]MCL1682604.1 hypothetical protein [Elizabethkingia anophelis]